MSHLKTRDYHFNCTSIQPGVKKNPYLCSLYGESESCLGWVGGHLSSPSVADCPSEQDVCPSEKVGAQWRKASSGGLNWKTKPEHCPCGLNTSYKTKSENEGFKMMLWTFSYTFSPSNLTSVTQRLHVAYTVYWLQIILNKYITVLFVQVSTNDSL